MLVRPVTSPAVLITRTAPPSRSSIRATSALTAELVPTCSTQRARTDQHRQVKRVISDDTQAAMPVSRSMDNKIDSYNE